MADIADMFSDSDNDDSDDSDDSERAFDVEIEKCEKRLYLAKCRKKYRNEWDYVTDRWQYKHIHIVLKDLEQKWRVYSAGNHEQLQNVSDAFRYLEEIYRCREKKYALPMCSYNAANLFFGSVKLMPKRPPPTLSSARDFLNAGALEAATRIRGP